MSETAYAFEVLRQSLGLLVPTGRGGSRGGPAETDNRDAGDLPSACSSTGLAPEVLATAQRALTDGVVRHDDHGTVAGWDGEEQRDAMRQTREDYRAHMGRAGLPVIELAPWPNGRTFALWLSHDVDQIFDREVFRVLADVNHLRRRLTAAEPGHAPACLRRIVRSMLAPAPPGRQFEAIRSVERRHGWRSTFFFLEGDRWSRYGARYSLRDQRVQDIARLLLAEECEIGVHGGWADFNSATGYRRAADAIKAHLGAESRGIRNHYLRWSFPETWQAQAQAGFSYDSTLAFNDRLGDRSGLGFPFFTFDPAAGRASSFVELPLLVMDTTVFRRLRLQGQAAFDAVAAVVERVVSTGGLVSLLWHNNYFAEEEYAGWQAVYEGLLSWLSARRPWCATGVEIDTWWRARAGVELVETRGHRPDPVSLVYRSRDSIDGLTLRLSAPPGEAAPEVSVEGASASVEHSLESVVVVLGHLDAGQRLVVSVAG
jgi:hypothetical protein